MHWIGMVSFSSPSQAREMAAILLEKKVVACTQIVNSLDSAYWWKGKIEREHEALLIFKTTEKKAKAAIAAIEKNHSYEVPVIEAWPVKKANPKAVRWMEKELE
jgi:periplasmic divalent cation tolerance protein